MKITVFTSDSLRHTFLINKLFKVCDKLFVVREYSKIKIKRSNLKKKYFQKVKKQEIKLFGPYNKKFNQEIKILRLKKEKLNSSLMKKNDEYFKSHLYIVFGSSIIKGELLDFLIKKKAINIHMGISPYYRGTDCNFWAIYDDNSDLVGATIHRLSKKIDEGQILYHALSDIKTEPFEYTMSTVKSAILSLIEKIKDKSIFKIKTINQNKKKLIRFSKKKDFNSSSIIKFNKKKIDLTKKNFKMNMFKLPFILRKN